MKSFRLALSALVLLSVVGCASPALTENMIVPATQLNATAIDAKLKAAIAVSDVQEFPKFASFLSAEDFKKALSGSLSNAGLLAGAASSKYDVKAKIADVKLPAFAITMESTLTVDYTVVERASGKTVFSKSVVAQGVATGSEAFVGTKRLQLAVERSVQKNIKSFIDELAKAAL